MILLFSLVLYIFMPFYISIMVLINNLYDLRLYVPLLLIIMLESSNFIANLLVSYRIKFCT